MTPLETLAAQQREIGEIASTLRPMLTAEQLKVQALAKIARTLLCDLCTQMKIHLAEEDEGLYPDMLAHADAQIKNLAWGFQSGDRPLRRQFDEYEKRWLKDCRFSFTDEFLEQTQELLKPVDDLMKREQLVMIPQLLDSGMFPVRAA